jgi:hypothetical protein
VKEKGDVKALAGLTEPSPSSDILTFVAFPPKVPLTVIDDVPQVLPLALLRVTTGAFTHCPSVSITDSVKKLTRQNILLISGKNNYEQNTLQRQRFNQ